ncbi:hypothetical protein A2130_04855 [Candidatus Woesebacteria bacterium GWC2_33_12]|uniref:Uncharacterized protein n=1 Tax=Candidatus Woesebacteria bacterium GW2011_GWB1_33_22 TaxID=1618566 RepID=A0A0G0A0A0_9BACT|nr:MAG: hypothetical protein UR29_C0011G0002 [Candidatus Woesebacteria bacterium GW2011_GWC2_33_12]KKP41962.1 MAG: hypothetical protein UR33_C0007G0025 [Candidatus Woesebacteria bacterium GW2011_GWA2_33_20]KKP44601.1 MAG: hypothetical protein UR35_C0007G0017 [Candidatus Woesebacteria bacterium GW2011_GWB1_33_22]KKP46405.1 MAG: hypothetical protein UR37_C0008G0017 [Microgenomates group bacterium GW2011_GWC1_33_28]KKP50459.1 MAG: hypothetical protein UR41_C0007G0017 [Candidatus Woesebacteria bact
MSTYYKKHELSLSLNGDKIQHIARNASGVVVFRESSEKALKRAIDGTSKEATKEVIVSEPVTEEEIFAPTQKRVTRGSDGKFISKSQLDTDEDLKKKSFWNKLTS